MERVENSKGRNLSGLSGNRAAKVLGVSAVMSLVMAVPAFAQGLGTEAASAATAGVGDAVLVAGIIIAFAVGYKLVRKITG